LNRYIFTILFATLTSSAVGQSFPVGELRIAAPSDVATVRAQIIATISGASTITPPSMSINDGECCGATSVAAYFDRTPTTTKWLGWSFGFGGGTLGVVSRTHFTTFSGSTCLFVYNGGHGQGFFSTVTGMSAPWPGDQDYLRRIVSTLGCDVILSSMPVSGENYFSSSYIGYPYPTTVDLHGAIGTLSAHAPPAGTPLRYFIEPAIGSINYALSLRSYDKIIVSGLSGGGWTTTLLAAIDPRITHSYAVAGSVPFASRVVNEGDWEQRAGMAPLGVDYSDLYLMGTIDASGAATRHVGLLYNGNDECCFKGAAVNGFAGWLKARAAAAGFGPLRIFIDPDKTQHAVHSTHVDAILADILAP
jgi:hypothetical protein